MVIMYQTECNHGCEMMSDVILTAEDALPVMVATHDWTSCPNSSTRRTPNESKATARGGMVVYNLRLDEEDVTDRNGLRELASCICS